ncbi:hypothetical protein [Hyphomicrobium sp. 99]|uniref:hypothetical protein n=1 Tax=Hyphomicrobium sp. 99 TaxID=1163419 RepID=UPI0005F78AD1|nr:hypothetical protein [Hyphomicrobium sp. 99]
MASIRSAAIVVMFAMATMSCSSISFAQDLSDASLIVGTDWPRGYMTLGGHLGKALAKPTRVKKAASRQRPRVQKIRKIPEVANRRDITPLYLVSMSLDSTGLNLAGLPSRQLH